MLQRFKLKEIYQLWVRVQTGRRLGPDLDSGPRAMTLASEIFLTSVTHFLSLHEENVFCCVLYSFNLTEYVSKSMVHYFKLEPILSFCKWA